MVNAKAFLGITVPIAILITLYSLIEGHQTIGTIALGYSIIGGIFWKFARHF